jgi:hypothetical protein
MSSSPVPPHVYVCTLERLRFLLTGVLFGLPPYTALGTPGGVQRPCGPVPVRHCERGYSALPPSGLRPPPYTVDVDEAQHGELLCLPPPPKTTYRACQLLMLLVSPCGTWRTHTLTPSSLCVPRAVSDCGGSNCSLCWHSGPGVPAYEVRASRDGCYCGCLYKLLATTHVSLAVCVTFLLGSLGMFAFVSIAAVAPQPFLEHKTSLFIVYMTAATA